MYVYSLGHFTASFQSPNIYIDMELSLNTHIEQEASAIFVASGDCNISMTIILMKIYTAKTHHTYMY